MFFVLYYFKSFKFHIFFWSWHAVSRSYTFCVGTFCSDTSSIIIIRLNTLDRNILQLYYSNIHIIYYTLYYDTHNIFGICEFNVNVYIKIIIFLFLKMGTYNGVLNTIS